MELLGPMLLNAAAVITLVALRAVSLLAPAIAPSICASAGGPLAFIGSASVVLAVAAGILTFGRAILDRLMAFGSEEAIRYSRQLFFSAGGWFLLAFALGSAERWLGPGC